MWWLSLYNNTVLYCAVEVNGEKPPAVVDSDEDEPEYYNKTKSFFDNISCEASDRASGWVELFLLLCWFNFLWHFERL